MWSNECILVFGLLSAHPGKHHTIWTITPWLLFKLERIEKSCIVRSYTVGMHLFSLFAGWRQVLLELTSTSAAVGSGLVMFRLFLVCQQRVSLLSVSKQWIRWVEDPKISNFFSKWALLHSDDANLVDAFHWSFSLVAQLLVRTSTCFQTWGNALHESISFCSSNKVCKLLLRGFTSLDVRNAICRPEVPSLDGQHSPISATIQDHPTRSHPGDASHKHKHWGTGRRIWSDESQMHYDMVRG